MNPIPPIASNKKRKVILIGLILIIVAGIVFYFVILKKPLPKLSSGPKVSTKTEYRNPFDKKTQYENPFGTYKNPFVVAK